MNAPTGKRVKRTRLVRTDRFVVAVKVKAIIPDADPSEPYFEPEVVELLREVKSRAMSGDIEWLKQHGKVYATVEAALTYRTDPNDSDRFKCGSEINQLHNQQFVLATTAATLFAAYAGLVISQLLPERVLPETEAAKEAAKAAASVAGDVLILSSLAVFAVLLLLFKWSLHLRKNSKVIAIWLEETGSSAWERDVQHFSNKSSFEGSDRDRTIGGRKVLVSTVRELWKKIRGIISSKTPLGQTKHSSEVFFFLGFLTAGVFIWIWLRDFPQIRLIGWHPLIVCFFAVIYLGAVLFAGVLHWHEDNQQSIRTQWFKVLQERAIGWKKFQEETGEGATHYTKEAPPDDWKQ